MKRGDKPFMVKHEGDVPESLYTIEREGVPIIVGRGITEAEALEDARVMIYSETGEKEGERMLTCRVANEQECKEFYQFAIAHKLTKDDRETLYMLFVI